MTLKHLDLTNLDSEAEAAWVGVLDLAEVCPEGWSLAGGQAVMVQTALRGHRPERPSSDADLVIDLRSDPGAARKLVDALREIGFSPALRDAHGRVHRWEREDAQIDVLQPRYLGDRAERGLSRAGLETIAAPGAQHLLSRTEQVNVTLGERSAPVRTPTALGIIVAKAAGFQEIIEDRYRVRHLADILTVGSIVSGRDLRREAPYTRLERQRVGNAIGVIRGGKYAQELMAWFPNDLSERAENLTALHRAHSARPALKRRAMRET
ncbi:hypothetical protein JD292_10880 [Leucobacter sp. CSA2]|uniref:Uncharacterized protein n=1 Tax=Leucobacter edaphi TaxID=2796472 RepID=A0A934QF49_9MICO|nr:hypothetical protein [Leucobacter edaphi]MBK0422574.1 hypothetical protein [Leucobacter edaphi]